MTKYKTSSLGFDYDALHEMVQDCEDCGLLTKDDLCPYHQNMKDQLDEENTG